MTVPYETHTEEIQGKVIRLYMIPFKDNEERQRILALLELNMNEEFKATLQYICHRISARGIDEVIADSFKSAGLDEMAHILVFSDLITKFGGVPRFTDWEIDRSSDLVQMLKKDIELEQAAQSRYEEQLKTVRAYPELCTIIEGILSDEQDHEDTFRSYLGRLQSEGCHAG